MADDAFGRSPRWSVGIEEELFVLDRETLEPAPVPEDVLDGTRLKAELFRTVLELNTGVCPGPAEAGADLATLRREARDRVAGGGLLLAAAGTWPTAVSEEQPVTPVPGYLEFVEYAGVSARRQYCAGLHVHVGVESPEECLAKLEAVLPWLPLLLAVSANSPYAGGAETGLASRRAELLALLPRSGAPPVFASFAEWEQFAGRLVTLGLADSRERIWWDARPHPRYGTLEVRMPDQPTRVEVSVAFAALVQALVARALPGRAADRGVYAQNRWAALHRGAGARLIHPEEGRLATVDELLTELLERLEPEAELVEPLLGLAQADEQLDVGRGRGLRALNERLATLTYDGL
jgi:glutamate---cysteine ligase / carboxylate-amine ligase